MKRMNTAGHLRRARKFGHGACAVAAAVMLVLVAISFPSKALQAFGETVASPTAEEQATGQGSQGTSAHIDGGASTGGSNDDDGSTSQESPSVSLAAAMPLGYRANPQLIPNMPSTSSDVHVKLFNYKLDQVNYDNGGLRPFCFGNIGQDGGPNHWTGVGGGLYQGIVACSLGDNGYPTLNNNGGSLGYLFGEVNAAGVTKVNSGSDVDGLLFYDSQTGRYAFDSKTNWAEYNNSTGKFDVYDSGRFPEGLVRYLGAFMPFNHLSKDKNNYSSNEGYKLAEGDDYYFGMEVSTEFLMPKDGVLPGTNEPMTFDFEGDDDVWVYIDGKLVLDLGGIHDNYGGTINFQTGAISYSEGARGSHKNESLPSHLSQVFGSNWQDAYKTHTLKMFYLERGAGGSNCKVAFNLLTIPEGTISIAKQITDLSGGDVGDFANAEFTMQVSTADEEGGEYALYANLPYEVYKIDTNLENSKPIRTGDTNGNGQFTLKNGEFARLMGEVKHEGETESHAINKAMYYRVVELAADGYDKNDYTFNVADVEYKAEKEGQIGASAPIGVDGHSYVTVNNKFKHGEDYYTFIARKYMADSGNSTDEFKIRILNNENTAYTGTFYCQNLDGEFVTFAGKPTDQNGAKSFTADDGTITLKANMQAVLLGQAPGTSYKVVEESPGGNYEAPKYYVRTDSSNATHESPIVTVDKNSPNQVITVENTLKTSSIAIGKEVAGDAADTTQHYTFELVSEGLNGSFDVEYQNAEPSETTNHPAKIRFKDGLATLKLKHGETATINGLAIGRTVNVGEADLSMNVSRVTPTVDGVPKPDLTLTSQDGSQYTSQVDVAIDKDGTKVVFTNTVKFAPVTGFLVNSAPMIGLLAVALIGGSILAATEGKRAFGKHGGHGWKE